MRRKALNSICDAILSGKFEFGHDFSIENRQTCIGGACVQTFLEENTKDESQLANKFRSWLGLSETQMCEFSNWSEKIHSTVKDPSEIVRRIRKWKPK